MHAVYEYLLIGLMLVVIFGASVTMVQIIAVPMQGVSERQTLQVTGEKVMTQILSSTGDPADWGSSLDNTNPTYFGLARQVETTRQTYILDLDKVQRLNPDDPYRLDVDTVQKALNLERNYGFAIQIQPIFDISVTRQGTADIFKVNVFWREDGLPVTNANVTARMFSASVSPGPKIHYYETEQLTTITGVDGETLQPLDFTPYGAADMKILVVVVDYLGLKASHINAGDHTVPAYQVGNVLLINSSYQAVLNSSTPPSIPLYEVLAVRDYKSSNPPQYNYKIISVNTTLSDAGTVQGSFRSYNTTDLEPTAIGLFVVSDTIDGSYNLAYATREVDFNFSTSPDLTIFPPGVRLQRLVTIEESPYYAQLYLWRLFR